MGMIANYQYLSDDKLKQIKLLSNEENDLLDLAEDYAEEYEIFLDIDKMWDALVFVFFYRNYKSNIEIDGKG